MHLEFSSYNSLLADLHFILHRAFDAHAASGFAYGINFGAILLLLQKVMNCSEDDEF